jgi:hypothetical protein
MGKMRRWVGERQGLIEAGPSSLFLASSDAAPILPRPFLRITATLHLYPGGF